MSAGRLGVRLRGRTSGSLTGPLDECHDARNSHERERAETGQPVSAVCDTSVAIGLQAESRRRHSHVTADRQVNAVGSATVPPQPPHSWYLGANMLGKAPVFTLCWRYVPREIGVDIA
jgi:hypothetical protein